MNFFSVQNLNMYTKGMEMQMKWQKKKKTGDFSADGSTKITDPVRKQAEEIRKANANGSTKLSSQIDLKLKAGQKLTAEEMEYLRKTDPQKYQKIKSIEAEQENYERELKRCKTKEEVQRVRMNHTAASIDAVNSIMNNPAIPEEKKFELVMHEHYKHMAFETSTKEFVESGKYAKLPTDAEKAKAEKELEEAKKEELGIQDKVEESEESDELKNGTDSGESEKQEENTGQKAVPPENVSVKQIKYGIKNEHTMTVEEAESTPEAMKVKRSKAWEAYQKNDPEFIMARQKVRQKLDVKS